ncbi:UNVERIFIED_CONTAM: hypothetical protein Scaly_2016200 [Sesamum calycinum]|uniref:Transposase n=1 Tax=Sesamum calycinum TaxID=2727403 RepID=A0AAW2N1R8_9LAMI
MSQMVTALICLVDVDVVLIYGLDGNFTLGTIARQLEATPRAGLGGSSRQCLELGGVKSLPSQLEATPRAEAGGRPPPARGTASSWLGAVPPSQLEAVPRAGRDGGGAWLGAVPPVQLEAVPRAGRGGGAPPIFSSSRRCLELGGGGGGGGGAPPFFHLEAVPRAGLGEVPSSSRHRLELDELYDAEVNNSVNSEPDDRVEEVTSGSEGRGACVEQCESDDEVESEDEETESEGKEVESESEETEVSEVLERPSVVMALGVHDGTRGFLGLEFPGVVWTPPDGCFTVYATYFDSGFSIPPHPLLVKIIQSFGICISQLTPNSFMCFEGWRRRFRELGLPVSLASFHALWTVRRVAEVSTSTDDGRYFYFFPQKACRFLDGFTSSKGPWKERELGRLRQNFMAAGLFSQKIDITHYFPSGKKLEIDAVRARKAAVREQKRLEQELIQPRVGSSVSAAPVGASAGSGRPSPPPTTHTAGPSPPPKRPRGAPSICEGMPSLRG